MTFILFNCLFNIQLIITWPLFSKRYTKYTNDIKCQPPFTLILIRFKRHAIISWSRESDIPLRLRCNWYLESGRRATGLLQLSVTPHDLSLQSWGETWTPVLVYHELTSIADLDCGEEFKGNTRFWFEPHTADINFAENASQTPADQLLATIYPTTLWWPNRVIEMKRRLCPIES